MGYTFRFATFKLYFPHQYAQTKSPRKSRSREPLFLLSHGCACQALAKKRGGFGYSPEYLPDGSSKPLTDTVILSHLLSLETVGVYPLRPDNTTNFLAIDFDESIWLKDALSVQRAGALLNIPAYLERSRSGNGVHLWFFFAAPLLAWKARKLGVHLLQEAHLDSKRSYDRMFPNQDVHSGKGFGNLIALPLMMKIWNLWRLTNWS